MSQPIKEAEGIKPFDIYGKLGTNGQREVQEIVAASHEIVKRPLGERLGGLHNLVSFCNAVRSRTPDPGAAIFAEATLCLAEFFAGIDHENRGEEAVSHFLEAVRSGMRAVSASLKRGDQEEIGAYTPLLQGIVHLAIPRLPMDIQPGLFLQASDRLGKAIPLVSPRQADSLRASLEFCKNPRGLN